MDFATRNRSSVFEYFNAHTALSRIDDLIEDAKNLKASLDLSEPEVGRWYPWFGNEIVSYFAVGFVTCLEWHARSRLVDLLTHKPSAAKVDDLKILKEKVVLEMMAANVTVASIVGAATSVSSLDDYAAVFTRLLMTFDQNLDAFKAMKAKRSGTTESWIKTDEIIELQGLFEFRHGLVHEIGINRVGHRNIRDSWNPDEAIRIGELVQRAMKALEDAISTTVPTDFPNVLDAEWYPISEIDRLNAEILNLENEIVQTLQSWPEHEIGDMIECWEANKTASRDHQVKELEFIDSMNLAGWQYIDDRGPLKTYFLESRSNYLKEVFKILGGTYDLSKD